ncbi:hypothetical protein FB451DRAFT_1413765 [Mycena latifolia]|nr:hypothetical protein FB451DRAFT_1413765 [Mycena latifolia]
MYPNANANAYGARGTQASTASASQWFGEFASTSESEVEDSFSAAEFSSSAALEVNTPAASVLIAAVAAEEVGAKTEAKELGIAFPWSDTSYLGPSRYLCAPLSQSLCPELTHFSVCVDLPRRAGPYLSPGALPNPR